MASKRFPIAAGQTPSVIGGPRGPEAYRAELNAMRSGGASAAASAQLDFPDLTLPYAPLAPPRSLSPLTGGPIWRNASNMIPRDGLMRGRPCLGNTQGGAGSPLGPTPALTAGTNQELPVYVSGYLTPLSDKLFSSSLSGATVYNYSTGPFIVLVTNRQAYVYNAMASGWVNVTPTYTTGTIAVTNGSKTVTGTGTAWSARGITPFQHIKIAGVWYQIGPIASDTSLQLTANYAGATASGLSYTIQRTWDDPVPVFSSAHNQTTQHNGISCVIFNQTLYIAGTYLGGADGLKRPAVVKVTGLYSATPTTTYITAATALLSGLDFIANLTEISGIQCLQEGNVILSGATTTSEGVIFYSSVLSDSVWSVSPAGQTPVVVRPGPILALGQIGFDLTLHYADGIVLGIPTGLPDPPLAFQNTGAEVGCYAPRTLKTFGDVELFLTAEGQPYMFDRVRTRAIGDQVRKAINATTTAGRLYWLRNCVHAALNSCFREYTLYLPPMDISGAQSYDTPALTLKIEEGSWWPQTYPALIGAVGDTIIEDSHDYGLAAVYSDNVGAPLAMTYVLSYNTTSDLALYTGATPVSYFLETDDLDFGASLSYKAPDSLVVFLRGYPSAATATLVSWVSRNGGGTWVAAATKTIAATVGSELPLQFSFRDAIGAGILFRYRIVLGTGGAINFAPTRLLIEADVLGDAGTVQL